MVVDPVTLGLGALFELGKTAIEKIWPDPTKRAEELRKLEELRQQGDLAQLNAHIQLMIGQLEVNKEEAKHPSVFVAGWRPMVGWTAAISLGLAYIPKTIALTGIWIWQAAVIIQGTTDVSKLVVPVFPDLGLTDLIGLLGSMLGVGIMRSIDKANRVETTKIG